MNYYNEFDPKAAAWLRELITAKLIPNGHIDTRSITDVLPADLLGFSQCHFFAGIGGWPLALQIAGWPEDRPVWTGSCPCQPFSVAGAGLGEADERHLWPVFRDLIRECRPAICFGEQVASKAGRGWLAGVFADLEGMGYCRAGADLCAPGVGAPHIRQRLYWLANSEHMQGRGELQQREPTEDRRGGFAGSGVASGLEHAMREGRERQPFGLLGTSHQGGWGDFDILPCRDGKARRVESGTFPLVAGLPRGLVHSGYHGVPINPKATAEGRVMRLKGYGNSIIPALAAEFIQAAVEAMNDSSCASPKQGR